MTELSPATWILLATTVAAVAFLYSSVGHGGATGYLAVLALVGVAPTAARPAALVANCLVAGIAWWRFARAGHANLRLLGWLLAGSVPCAWLGSRLTLPVAAYGALLGAVLIAAGLTMLVRPQPATDPGRRPPSVPLALAVGAALGLLAGMTGIGGGVFLSPLLLLLRWVPPKTTGGISAPFILLNSAAGLVGLGAAVTRASPGLLLLALPATAGALLGTRLGVRWSEATFGRVLALVLVVAGGKLLWTTLG